VSILRLLDILAIVLAALVVGVFWGPWLALTRSIGTLAPETFLVIVHRLDRNLGRTMTALFPLALASLIPVLVLTIRQPVSFILELGAFVLLVLTLVVTAAVEVPIVTQIRGWTESTMPVGWEQRRDRWVSFHLLRVIPGIIALGLLVGGALWQR
jgi:uncharacterized membrane protein